jgi:hypothetical protein
VFGAFPFLTAICRGRSSRARSNGFWRASTSRSSSGRVKPQASSLSKRWIVERIFAWPGRFRRRAKDWECLNHKALASIRLMLRRLSNPA